MVIPLQKEFILTGIPDDDVDAVVEDFKSERAMGIKERQADGSWTIRVACEEILMSCW